MLKNILLLFTSTLLVLFLMEAALRMLGFHQPIRVLCYHPVMKRVYCSNTEGELTHDKVKSYVRINSDGLLDKEYSREKTPGTLRIAVLGDSFAAAEYVGPEQSFHGILEREIPKALNIPTEVINFAVDGTGTWHQLQMFHLKAKEYKPDLTILAFYWGNDIYNNIVDLKDGRPNPLLDEYPVDSSLLKLQVVRKNFNRWIWNHSSTYQFFRKRYNILELKIRHILWPAVVRLFEKSAPQKKNIQNDKIKKPLSSWGHVLSMDSEGWTVTKKLLIKLRDEVEASGSAFLLIHFGALNEYKKPSSLPVEEFDRFLNKQNIASINLFDEFNKIGHESFKKALYLSRYPF